MGDKLWPTFKNSQCQLNRLLKVPLGLLLLHNELTDNTRSTLHVLNIVVYTLHSDFYQYTLLETMTHVFETYTCFRKELNKMLVRIFLHHKQAHLFGTIVVTKKLNLIGCTCFSSHRTFETHFPRQSASTEAIFSST